MGCPILLFGPCLTVACGLAVLLRLVELLSRYSALLSGLLLGRLLLIRAGGLSRLRSRGFGRSMMIVFSSCQGMMQLSWVSLWMLMRFLVRGSSGLVLLRLLLLTLSSFVGVLSRPEVWFLDGRVLCSGLSGLEVTRRGRLGVMLLMLSMLLMCS